MCAIRVARAVGTLETPGAELTSVVSLWIGVAVGATLWEARTVANGVGK